MITEEIKEIVKKHALGQPLSLADKETLRRYKEEGKPKPKEEKDETCDVGTLSRLFNMTTVRVQQLAKEGIIVKGERGKYELWPSIRGYIKYLQERKVNQWDADGDDDNYTKHRSRLTQAKADMAQMQAAAMKGEFHEASVVQEVWIDMLMNCRSKLLALPTKAAPKLRKETSLAVVKNILEEGIHEALQELSEYDPSRITNRYIQKHREDVESASTSEGE
jgi:phage terminase Nu1 subunit (DNA packaging protein)